MSLKSGSGHQTENSSHEFVVNCTMDKTTRLSRGSWSNQGANKILDLK